MQRVTGTTGLSGTGRSDWQTRAMHARSALFDVYGDHLATRDHRAPVAGLVRLLGTLGIAAPAVRTAISRMVAQGWLEHATVEGARGYAATPQAVRRLAETSDRVYRRRQVPWDGEWRLVLLAPFDNRAARTGVQRDLAFLGYAELTDRVWVSPFERAELEETLARAGARATTATASRFDPADAPVHAWDLPALGAAYDAWLRDAADAVARHLAGHDDPEEAAFAARFHLVHEWRKFLFRDPELPDELLPPDWPGRAAADYFRREAARLEDDSRAFLERTLDKP
jgi:phenylacetic acid degradation operon negative regulatory protein